MDGKDEELTKHILNGKAHAELSGRLRAHVTEDEYKNRVLILCFERQLKFGKVVRLALKDEHKYFKMLELESRNKMRIFPYHLQERLVAIGVTPFLYYLQMLKDNLKHERSYDQLPNFTAADVLRLTGVGRNEYIEQLNQSRTTRWLNMPGLLRKASGGREGLPKSIANVTLKPWWNARIGFPSELQVQSCSAEARILFDQLMDDERCEFPIHELFDRDGFDELHSSGLLFIVVPIYPEDHFRVPVLDGFVMNRLSGDYMESLLYKVFSTMSSQSVGEMSELLDEKVEVVAEAISTLNRLGFVEKVESACDFEFDSDNHSSSSKLIDDESVQSNDDSEGKLGLIYDSSLAALLMMGNLSAGLKRHAVTMFEVGQLRHDQITALIDELRQIDDSGVDGQAQMYFHAGRALLLALEILRLNSKVDMLRAETLNDLQPEILDRMISNKYSMLIAMTDLSCPLYLLPKSVPFVGYPGGYRSNPWMRILCFKVNASGPTGIVLPRGCRIRKLPDQMATSKQLKVCPWDQESQIIDGAMALYYLNEALVHHPMFVSEYAGQSEAVNLPMPCDEEELLKVARDQKYVKSIQALIDFRQTVGYFSFQKFGEKNYLDSVSFGLPLLSLELAAKVCDRMNSIEALGMVKHANWTSELDKLTELYGDGEREAWPTQPLSVERGQIRILSEEFY